MKSALKILSVLFAIGLCFYSARAQNNSSEKYITVCVTDKNGEYSGGLKSENFQIEIDGKQQEITSFDGADSPASVVFMIDLSSSQKYFVALLAKGIEKFINESNSSNEYTVIAFNEKVQSVLDKTQDIETLSNSLNTVLNAKTKGATAFYDSVYLGIEKADAGKHQKKFVFIFSDGMDSQSRFYDFQNVVESLKRSNVLTYTISYVKRTNDPMTMILPAQGELETFAAISGGSVFMPAAPAELVAVMKRIILETKNQYRIGFKITGSPKTDAWRTIKVKAASVSAKGKKIKLLARTRSGIYSTSAK